MKFWPVGVARTAEFAVGLTYLVAALLKAQDINGFLPQIYAYQIVESNGALVFIAFVALALETALGVGMVLGTPCRRLVFGLGAAMLCFFTGVILYAWQINGLEDCGCFGKVKFTPPQAIGKNLFMLALTGLAYYGLVWRGSSASPMKGGALRVGIAVCLAAVLCVGVIPQLGLSTPANGASGGGEEAGSSERTDVESGPFAGYVIETEFGQTYDLGKGDYLVALLSMTCDHCMDSVPQLNEFMFDDTLPPLLAICLEPEAGSMAEFRMFTQPQFPMHSLGGNSLSFFPLLEDASAPPRLVYVRDGVSLQSWEEEMPDYETLIGALEGAGFEPQETQ